MIKHTVHFEHDSQQYYAITTSMTFEKTVLVPKNAAKDLNEAIDLVDTKVELGSIDLLGETATCSTEPAPFAGHDGTFECSKEELGKLKLEVIDFPDITNLFCPRIDPFTAITCETESQAKLLMKIAEAQGWLCPNGKAPTKSMTHHFLDEDTTYSFEYVQNSPCAQIEKRIYVSEKNDAYFEEEFHLMDFDAFFSGASEYNQPFTETENYQIISKEIALALWNEDFCPTYKVYVYNQTEDVRLLGDIQKFNGWFAIKRDDWNRLIDCLLYSETQALTL